MNMTADFCVCANNIILDFILAVFKFQLDINLCTLALFVQLAVSFLVCAFYNQLAVDFHILFLLFSLSKETILIPEYSGLKVSKRFQLLVVFKLFLKNSFWYKRTRSLKFPCQYLLVKLHRKNI